MEYSTSPRINKKARHTMDSSKIKLDMKRYASTIYKTKMLHRMNSMKRDLDDTSPSPSPRKS
jgi:hypothetical protein